MKWYYLIIMKSPSFSRYVLLSILLDILTFTIPLYAIYFYSSAIFFGGPPATATEQLSVGVFFIVALLVNGVLTKLLHQQFPSLNFRATIALAFTSGIIFFTIITDLFFYYVI